MTSKALHALLLDQIKHSSREVDQEFLTRYLGTTDHKYGVRVPDLRKIAKTFFKEHKDLESAEITQLLDSLYRSSSLEEKNVGSELLSMYKDKAGYQVNIDDIYSWLSLLEGWAEVDNLCQNNFSAEEVLLRWPEWKELLTKLNNSDSISHRRASIVLTVRPLSETDDKRIVKQAFDNMENLIGYKEVMITKAISWALRSASDVNPKFVSDYIEKNRTRLPKIAYRETRKKIDTGKK